MIENFMINKPNASPEEMVAAKRAAEIAAKEKAESRKKEESEEAKFKLARERIAYEQEHNPPTHEISDKDIQEAEELTGQKFDKE